MDRGVCNFVVTNPVADLASPSPLDHMNNSLQNIKQLPTSDVVGVAFLKHILQ